MYGENLLLDLPNEVLLHIVHKASLYEKCLFRKLCRRMYTLIGRVHDQSLEFESIKNNNFSIYLASNKNSLAQFNTILEHIYGCTIQETHWFAQCKKNKNDPHLETLDICLMLKLQLTGSPNQNVTLAINSKDLPWMGESRLLLQDEYGTTVRDFPLDSTVLSIHKLRTDNHKIKCIVFTLMCRDGNERKIYLAHKAAPWALLKSLNINILPETLDREKATEYLESFWHCYQGDLIWIHVSDGRRLMWLDSRPIFGHSFDLNWRVRRLADIVYDAAIVQHTAALVQFKHLKNCPKLSMMIVRCEQMGSEPVHFLMPVREAELNNWQNSVNTKAKDYGKILKILMESWNGQQDNFPPSFDGTIGCDGSSDTQHATLCQLRSCISEDDFCWPGDAWSCIWRGVRKGQTKKSSRRLKKKINLKLDMDNFNEAEIMKHVKFLNRNSQKLTNLCVHLECGPSLNSFFNSQQGCDFLKMAQQCQQFSKLQIRMANYCSLMEATVNLSLSMSSAQAVDRFLHHRSTPPK